MVIYYYFPIKVFYYLVIILIMISHTFYFREELCIHLDLFMSIRLSVAKHYKLQLKKWLTEFLRF